MEKEYGKLTEDQFKHLVQKLPEIGKQESELQEAFRYDSKERARELFPAWSQLTSPRVT